MTQSMTAFARESTEQSWGALVWELRSVNHRYLDVNIKLPEELRDIENTIRARLSEKLKRGKIDCQLRYRPGLQQTTDIQVNEDRANAVMKACQVISKHLHQPSEMDVLEVLKWPGVAQEPETDVKPVMDAALGLFSTALESLTQARASEGERLQQMLEERCSAMKNIVQDLRNNRSNIIETVRNKIKKRIAELDVSVDNERFEQEVVYLLQKMDVDEELDRIDSHFVEVENSLMKQEPVGRRLDFLMQEFNREANTLGSKSADVKTSQAAVELKVLIEQMREQVQNIE